MVIYLEHSYCHRERSYCQLAYLKWEIDVDACACLRYPAVDYHPFEAQANGLVDEEMVELAVMLTAVLVAMDLIVDYGLAEEIEPIASVVVASLIVALVVPLHLADYVAFGSYLLRDWNK